MDLQHGNNANLDSNKPLDTKDNIPREQRNSDKNVDKSAEKEETGSSRARSLSLSADLPPSLSEAGPVGRKPGTRRMSHSSIVSQNAAMTSWLLPRAAGARGDPDPETRATGDRKQTGEITNTEEDRVRTVEDTVRRTEYRRNKKNVGEKKEEEKSQEIDEIEIEIETEEEDAAKKEIEIENVVQKNRTTRRNRIDNTRKIDDREEEELLLLLEEEELSKEEEIEEEDTEIGRIEIEKDVVRRRRELNGNKIEKNVVLLEKEELELDLEIDLDREEKKNRQETEEDEGGGGGGNRAGAGVQSRGGDGRIR